MLIGRVFYNNPVCPFVFVNSKIQQLHLYQISNSLIFKNRLSFFKVNESIQKNNWKTNTLEIYYLDIYSENISLLNVDKFACKNVKFLLIIGNINGIEKGLFKNFPILKFVSLKNDAFVNFFHSGTEWMNSLNADLDVNLDNKHAFRRNVHRLISLEINVFRFFTFNTYYDFPNEDICLFRDFPHNQLVLPIITFGEFVKKNLTCSCTLIWLLKNMEYFFENDFKKFDPNVIIQPDFQNDFDNITIRKCFREINFTREYEACNFAQRFNNCELKKFKMYPSTGVFNLVYLVEWFQYIIDVYFRTFLCCFGILTNFLTISVIRNKKHVKSFNNKMYKHILVNALFNILFSSTQLLALMNICIFPKTSFCSDVYKDIAVQYINIYFILFLGNSFRLTCTFSYISFSVTRFSLSTLKANNKCRIFIEKINLKRYYSIYFLVSLLFSSFLIYEHRVNSNFSKLDVDFLNDAYDVRYCEKINFEFQKWHRIFFVSQSFFNKCNLFKSLNLINNIIKNVLSLILSLVLDILMIRYSSKVIEKKKALNCPHLEEALKLKTKLNKMIITNGILFFISHLPEFIVTVVFIFSKSYILSLFCTLAYHCSDLLKTAQSFFFLSIAFQIFIFLKFDKNFQKSICDIFPFKCKK